MNSFELEEIRGVIDVEDELKIDLTIDEMNLIGEKKKQKDLISKWGVRLAKVDNEIKKIAILIDIKMRDLLVYYNSNERLMNSHEIKIHINADKDIVELRNKKRKLETIQSIISASISSIRERGRSIDMMMEISRSNI